jgi:hypothetical protein
VHYTLGLSPHQGFTYSAKWPSPFGRFDPRPKKRRRKSPLNAGGVLATSGRPIAVGRWGSGLGANPVDGDLDLGKRVVGGSPELGRDGDGGRAEGCADEGIDW